MELRLNAPLGEHIRLDFNPFKISDVSGHEPSWKDWTVIESHYVFIVQILMF